MPIQHIVKTGDTVSAIAQKYGVPITAVSGFRSNDPAVIFPDEILTIQTPQMPQAPTAPVVSPVGAVPEQAPLQAPTASIPAQPVPEPSQPAPAPPQTFKRTFRTPSGVEVPMDLSAEADALLGGEATRNQPITPPVLEKQTENFFGQFGVATDELKTGFELNPSLTLSYLVKQVMEATGLPDVRTNITNISKEIEGLANERDAEIADIQENPWKSAGSKQQLIQKITDKYEKKIANRTDRLTLMQNAYQDARQQAQFAATTAINLYDKERTFRQKQVEDTLDRAEKAAEIKRKETEAATEKKYEAGNIGEYQFYAEQEKEAGRTPMSFNNYQNLDVNRKAKAIEKVDKLTLDERKKLYPTLPLSLVGKNEANVIAELESSQVPSWYKELRREQVGIGPIIIKQEEWNLFRKQVLDTMKGQAQKGVPETDEIPSWVTE